VNAPADMSPISSLRRLMKSGALLPRPGQARPRRWCGVTLPRGTDRGCRTLLACFWLCKPQPTAGWYPRWRQSRRGVDRDIGRCGLVLEDQTSALDRKFHQGDTSVASWSSGRG
jgi:hypothetical protein